MDIDAFSVDLFEQAKRFLEKAKETNKQESKAPLCNAALLLAFSALEAHVNAISEELSLRPALSVLDQSILKETEYQLKNGQFQLTTRLKMYRLEDRIQFILTNFSIPGPSTDNTWWQQLSSSIKLRNQLVHPKAGLSIVESEVVTCLNAILNCLNFLYLSIFKKPYPSFKRGLNSSLTF
jgi:hypothetical protein